MIKMHQNTFGRPAGELKRSPRPFSQSRGVLLLRRGRAVASMKEAEGHQFRAEGHRSGCGRGLSIEYPDKRYLSRN